MERYTTYDIAVNFLHNHYILCNNVTNINHDGLDLDCRFELEDNEEIYQFYLTDCSEADVEFLERTFNLKFAYSESLDLFVLCVDHFGTSWNYVSCQCFDDSIPNNRL